MSKSLVIRDKKAMYENHILGINICVLRTKVSKFPWGKVLKPLGNEHKTSYIYNNGKIIFIS